MKGKIKFRNPKNEEVVEVTIKQLRENFKKYLSEMRSVEQPLNTLITALNITNGGNKRLADDSEVILRSHNDHVSNIAFYVGAIYNMIDPETTYEYKANTDRDIFSNYVGAILNSWKAESFFNIVIKKSVVPTILKGIETNNWRDIIYDFRPTERMIMAIDKEKSMNDMFDTLILGRKKKCRLTTRIKL